MNRKVRWDWKVWNSISLCWRRNRRQMPLLCQMLFELLQCCVLWWHRSYESFRVPEDITIRCLIIQNIMWGRPGPEVTAVPPVSNIRANMNMQMGQKAATGRSHVRFRNQSAVLRQRELTIIVGSSLLNTLQHLMAEVGWRCLCPVEPTQSWELQPNVSDD